MWEELVRSYYDNRVDEEWQRHDRHRMEFAISMRLLVAELPPTGRVLDCGGGPGRYALWLASRGYEVTLFDLSVGNLEKAREQAKAAGLVLTFEQGTAIDLRRFADSSFSAVLIMGPLYHLKALSDRVMALKEAARVLSPGGVLAAAFITRTAPLRYVAKEQAEKVQELFQPMLDVISKGDSALYPPADADHFHAYFAHPSEVKPLLRRAGLKPLGMYAVEGFVQLIDEKVNALEGDDWEAWVELNFKVAADPTLFSAADHLLAFARKP